MRFLPSSVHVTRISIHRNVATGHRYTIKALGCSKWTLFQAAKSGDIKQLDKCIQDNIDIGLKNAEDRTALHIAVANRQVDFVKHLLLIQPHCISKGADLDLHGLNALHIAVIQGDAESFKLLQAAGFDTSVTSKDGKTVRNLAMERHHGHLLQLITTSGGWPDLHHCAVNGSPWECSKLIEQSHDDIDTEVDTNSNPYTEFNIPANRKMTPLQLAFHAENISVLDVLVKFSSLDTIEACLSEYPKTKIHNILVKRIAEYLSVDPEDVQYGKLIETDENVLVIYTDEDYHEGTLFQPAGIMTVYKNRNVFDRDNEIAIDFELDMEEPGLTQEENDRMEGVIKANSVSLWKNHGNLNGIRPSAVRTRGGKAYRENCIVLCCQYKGFLSGREKPYPAMLSDGSVCFAVDVREDFTKSMANHSSDRLEPLACGGQMISSCRANNRFGTIGPFVQLPDGQTGFLTCAHVIDNNPAFGVQKDNNYNNLVYQPGRESGNLCGEVVEMKFKPSGYPSMDAAIVKITSDKRIPRSINFTVCEQAEHQAVELAARLTFNSGSVGTYTPSSEVFKFGAFTPVLQCKCSATGHEEKITYPQGRVLMKGLTKILCRIHHKNGDSGAGVFVKDKNDQLACVGLFFGGRGKEGFFIPIKDVLDQCGKHNLKTYN
ncbi:uncharacterized protein [Argopecten irradians]|uniref:uncharacterized protein isoform X2 n=1 Tax=Argopecten irradians TaxID=31199 RepID=UPI003718EE64